MNELYLYLGIYVLLLIIVSYLIGRNQSKEDFLISGRNRGGIQIMLSKFASAIGAGYFITYTGFAYEYGFGIFSLLIGIFFGYIVFAYWASPRIYKHSKEHKFYLMGDYVFHRTKSKFASKATNFLSNFILLLWLVVGVIGGAKIINDFGFLSYELAVVLTTVVILVYILIAGFKAVILTDVIQSVIIILLLFFVTIGVVGSESLSSLLSVSNSSFDIGTAVGFFLFGLLGIFSYSNMFQLCYASKSRNHLRHGLGFSFAFVLFAIFLLLLIGLFMASHSPGIDSGLVFTEALKNFLPESLLPVAVVLFFAGIMSSADTNIYAIASHHAISGKNISLKKIRTTALILVVITMLIALIFSDIVDISVIAAGFTLTLSFPIIYLLFGGRSSKKFMASLILSVLCALVGMIVFGLEPVVGLLPVIGGVVGLLWKR